MPNKKQDRTTVSGKTSRNQSQCEQRYRALFESASDAILIFDKKLVIVDANPRACEMFGHDRNRLCGMVVDSLQPAHVREQRLEEKGLFETEALTHGGKVMNVEVALTRFSEDGEDRFLARIRDITGHKQALNELNEREETVRTIINASVEPMMLIDTRGIILNLNQTAAMRLGDESGALIGANSYELLDKELAEQRKSYIDIVLQWAMPVKFEEFSAGMHFETAIHPVSNEHGEIERLAIFSRDATMQKKKEQHLASREMRYRTVFNCLSCAALLVDGETGFIREANDQAERLSGRVRSELKEMHVSELFTDDIFKRCAEYSDPHAHESCSETMTSAMQLNEGGKIQVVMNLKKFWMADEPYVLIEMHDLGLLRSFWGKMQS